MGLGEYGRVATVVVAGCRTVDNDVAPSPDDGLFPDPAGAAPVPHRLAAEADSRPPA